MSSVPFTHNHPDEATLGAYHDGELRGFARAEVEQHLAECPRCRRRLGEIDAVDDALRALPPLEPPSGVDEAVLSRIEDLRPRRRPRRIVWGIAAAVAAVAAIIGGYDYFAQPRVPLSPFASQRPAAHRPSSSGGITSQASPNLGPAGQASAGPNDMAVPAAPPNSAAHSGKATRSFMRQTPGAAAQSATGTAPNAIDARLIARVGEVDLRVRDVQRTFNAVNGIAGRENGYVSDSNNNASAATNGAYAATLALRVPAASFQATVDALAALPHTALTERSTSTDVTDSYHDLQAQLQALQATRAQLTALMRQAHSIKDAMTVLDRLTDINTGIDSVQSQIMAGANSVMLSTITVNLTPEPRKHLVIAPVRRQHTQSWQPGRDLANALSNVLRALQAIASVAIYGAIYLSLPALLIALALLLRRLRHWTPRRT